MKTEDQQFRLRRFWGTAIFSLGIFWGFANLVYSPITALTSIVGSSWFEVAIILAGGLLTFVGSIGAFYRRLTASRMMLSGGIVLFAVATAGQALLQQQQETHGLPNLLLLFLSGIMAIALGAFGVIGQRKGWPPLRRTAREKFE
jgi:hypothetical protein